MQNEKIFDAIAYAARAHTGQFRKTTHIPYIIHPLRVAEILIELDCPEDVVIAGILHDTIEDTSVTFEDLQKNFGETIARLVEGASEPDKKDTWENRKRHTIEFLKFAPMEVLLITCADKLDNIQSTGKAYRKMGDEVWSRFRRPKQQQEWYYKALVQVLGLRIKNEPAKSLFRQFEVEVEKVFG